MPERKAFQDVSCAEYIHVADTEVNTCRYASVFQMLRGTMVVFAGLLTIIILRRALHLHHWMGIILILAGATLVGTSRYLISVNVSFASSCLLS